jgi:type II secretory pathway component GspD/PulD (secretin)
MTGNRYHRIMNATVFRVVAVLSLVGIVVAHGDAQTRRHIKVLLNSQQTEKVNREAVQGSGSVVIRRGTVNPSGSIVANERQTNVKRTSGIFTLVLDGSESILSVATRVPRNQIGYYQNYALGTGYIERQIIFDDVGTSLRVNALILPDGQIKLRLTPRISYFSVQRPGAIDFTEAATELIVPDGQPVSLGGLTSSMHEVTRQILGYGARSGGSETELTVTATIQQP